MRNNLKDKQGFSIVVAVFMIGFLLVLTTGVFNLVLREMKDNKGSENYLKAYASAEGAMELGLLGIKKNGYGFDESLEESDPGSESLSFNSLFRKITDPRISYDMDIATGSLLNVTMTGGETVLIPLFSNGIGVKDITLTANTDILWNIVGNGQGMSGSGSFIPTTSQIYKKNDGKYTLSPQSIQTFLGVNVGSYLMLFNKGTPTNFSFKATDSEFSKPVGKITSSVTVGKYKQNISTSIDNTEFLNMLKYSIFSK